MTRLTINTNFLNDFIFDVLEGDECEAMYQVCLHFGANLFGLRAQDTYLI